MFRMPALSRRFFAVGLAIHFALVTAVSVLAYRGQLPGYTFMSKYDYVLHGFFAGPLAFFLDGALGWRGKRVPLAAVIVTCIVAVEELAQSLSPRRSTSLHDFVGDVVGIAVCTLASRILMRRLQRSEAADPRVRAATP